jgi:hypothetical protein
VAVAAAAIERVFSRLEALYAIGEANRQSGGE